MRNKEINDDFWNLWHRYKELGYFEPSMTWFAKTITANMIIAVVGAFSVYNYPTDWFFNGLLAGFFICQQAFLTHDS